MVLAVLTHSLVKCSLRLSSVEVELGFLNDLRIMGKSDSCSVFYDNLLIYPFFLFLRLVRSSSNGVGVLLACQTKV